MAKLKLAREPLEKTVGRDTYLPAYMRLILRAFTTSTSREYEEAVGITSPDFGILSALSNYPGAKAAEITDVLGLDKSVVSRRLQRLTGMGLVAEELEAGQRKLYLTQMGVTVHDSVLPITMSHHERLLEGFTPSERDQLMGYLHRLHGNIPRLASPN